MEHLSDSHCTKKITKSLKRILVLSGIYKYYQRYITDKTEFVLDRGLSWGGCCALGEDYPKIVRIKRHLPKDFGGNSLIANIMTGSHIAHELGHIIAYYEKNQDKSEKAAYRLVLEYFENLSKNLKHPPFKLTIVNRAKGKWYVDFKWCRKRNKSPRRRNDLFYC
ncbi:MAG: hypothetical protein ABIL39_10315 [candidate division WOR-3 bacterium]